MLAFSENLALAPFTQPIESRGLTEAERALLGQYVGGNPELTRNIIIVSATNTLDGREAFTVGNVIYVRSDIYSADPTTAHASLLVHEGLHVQQFGQQSVYYVALSSALAQLGLDGGYSYAGRLGDSFYSLNVEQQATLVTDRYLLSIGLPPSVAGVTLEQLNQMIGVALAP